MMRCKTQFSPSHLTCPQTHVWVLMEQCKRLLDQCKYHRFAEQNAANTSATHCDNNKQPQLPFSEAQTSELSKGANKRLWCNPVA
ncbi:unnamed protein product [Taenia asiatica]|uniref:CX9C domain-containing protein n=1 Tax=Taenia asiatica TaxID=60517 RepID=A0A0R3WED4_TAEAS|nr:unnamed protein product [Taenia asiatica]